MVRIISISNPELHPASTYGSLMRAHNLNEQPGIRSGTRRSRSAANVCNGRDMAPLVHVSTKIAFSEPLSHLIRNVFQQQIIP